MYCCVGGPCWDFGCLLTVNNSLPSDGKFMQQASVGTWERIADEIRKRVRPQQFDTWFRKVCLAEEPEGQAILKVPSEFWRDWLRSHYMTAIEEAVRAVVGRDIEVGFIVDASLASARPRKAAAPSPEAGRDGREKPGAALNARYTFANFVVGPSNRFAHAASMVVAEAPSKAYNPLYIYGAVGMGKTHLIQAICHACLSSRMRTKVIYVPCEAFLNDYVSAIKNGSLESFRKRYRQAGLLVIDDIHFLANKERSSFRPCLWPHQFSHSNLLKYFE